MSSVAPRVSLSIGSIKESRRINDALPIVIVQNAKTVQVCVEIFDSVSW